MLLSTRAFHRWRIFASKLNPGGRPFYSTRSRNAARLLSQRWSPFTEEAIACLEERNLLVTGIEQRNHDFAVSATFAKPRLLSTLDPRYRPERRTNSWSLPSLAVKCARAFFAKNPDATEYGYCLHLRPFTEPYLVYNNSLSYFIETAFSRDEDGLFEATQRLSCSSSPPSASIGEKGATVSIDVKFHALWLSPQGRTTLSDEELDSVATSISEKGIDLLEPLEAGLMKVYDDLGDRRGFRPNRAIDMCHDVLENYQSQQQAWRVQHVEHQVIDKPRKRYGVRTPAHHLGQQYLGIIGSHRAIIALGSNVGNRIENIEQSLQAMRHKGIKIRSTSFLYETEAMYYEHQDHFLNGVCEVETTLEPLALLEVLQQIEIEFGRVKVIDKGPRSMDLDILLYDFDNVQHPRLQIPHKLMLERDFVLRPLADIIPGERLPPPHNKRSILAYLEELDALKVGETPSVVSNLGSKLPLSRPYDPSRRTKVMAVLNSTPDSFSDGGKHNAGQLDAVEAEVRRFIAEGATIIDVGGQSTRPGATRISWQEELERVRPVIERIRSIPEAQKIAISVDTFYADVARGAVAAGADIINDVSGGILDPQMLPMIADLQVTVVLMHMRGTPNTMKDMTDYPDGVVEGVANELLDRVRDAERAGIPRWRIVLDPGIGFAKTHTQNLELLRNLESLRNWPGLRNFPWLVGTSRKGFIGKITGVSAAAERGWGTAATVTTSVAGGVDIVRVHDVSEMAQVVNMADATYRVTPKLQKASALARAVSETTGAEPETASSLEGHSTRNESNGLELSSNFYIAVEKSRREFRSTALDLPNPT